MTAAAPAAPASAGGHERGARLDHLFALRPLLWIPAIALFEAGRAAGGGAWWPSPRVAPALVSLLAILGAVQLANGWNDRAGDRINRKGREVASGALRGWDLAALGAALLILALVAATCPIVSPGARVALLGALGLGAAYVTPPLEWKRRPGLDLLAQASGYGVVAFLLGIESSPSSGQALSASLARALPYALGIAAVGVITMLADRTGDDAVGQRTTVVALGPRRSVNLALGLAVATSAAGLAVGAWAPGLWGLLAIAAMALFAPAGPPSRAERGIGGGGEREGWNRIAIALQVAFVLLLLPCTPVPLLSACVIGAAAAAHDRSRGGQGYPIRSGSRDGIEAERPKAERG